MLTREDVLSSADPLDLFARLGWPIAPVELSCDEWRSAGIAISWNGDSRLVLASRLRRFDLFVLTGSAIAEDAISNFLRTYREYNQLTKSTLIYKHQNRASIYDLAADRRLRRLDVDLTNPTPHALDRLNCLAFGDEASLPKIFDRALDRETISRQFFLRFRTAVRGVASALRESCPEESGEAVEAEALLILSRLLFLAFVQIKGWLNGERRFLADRLDRALRDGRSFFSDVLEPLFFGCLNTPASERTAAARRLGRIPYLNGGLFEPSPLERRNATLHLPNELLQKVMEEVFERCDFSIEESDVASSQVDPEMLGKVFESLMADDERAASGSFYTPREIVDVLTQRAISEWLYGGEPEPLDRDSAAAALQRLDRVTVLDPACGSGAFLLSALRVLERLHRELAAIAGVAVPANLRQQIVERSLYGVDLKAEAVRLCELRLWLAVVAAAGPAIEGVQPLPNLDRNIVQGSSLLSPTDFLGDARADIYRDWVYALRAQREISERYRVAPRAERPVLARLMRTNDRRLASDLVARAIDVDEKELQHLVAPQRDLFGRALVPDLEACRELQQRIAANKVTLSRIEDGSLDFFSFDIHFAHVMHEGGFDIVAGNPPWVRNARIEPRLKRMYRDRFVLFRGSGDAAFHQPDLSLAFFERAVALSAPDGVVSMLMPAKVLNAAYATPLRRFVSDRLTVVAIDDWSDDPRRWFEADTFPLGITVQRRASRKKQAPISVTACGRTFAIGQHELNMDDTWALVEPAAAAVLRRLRNTHRSLEDVLRRRPVMGVKTGRNADFFVEGERLERGHVITTDGHAIPFAALSRCVRGRDVRRWSASDSQWMLWPPSEGWREVPEWLERFAESRGMRPSDFRLSYSRPEHLGIKVAWKDLSRGFAAAVLPDVVHAGGHPFPLVPNQTLYSIDAVSLDEAYALAAMLNSTIADALLLCVAERAKDAHYRYFARTVARLPFPAIDRECDEWDRLIRLSRRAHAHACVANAKTLAAPDDSATRGRRIDEDVDRLVAALYGVTGRELQLLRRFVEDRLGAR